MSRFVRASRSPRVGALAALARRWLGEHRHLVLAGTAGAFFFIAPGVLSPYALITVCYALVLAIACLGLNLLFGTTGLLSFGHAAFFGVGAYTGAFLYRFFGLESFELYLLAGIAASTLFAAVIGFLCVRATRIYFSILTLAFGQILYSLVIDGAIFRLFGPLGWALYLLAGGSLYIPIFTILGTQYAPGQFTSVFYYVIVAAFFGAAFLLWRISRSPFGIALRALRDNETRAVHIGIPVRRYRWYAFILSGAVMGLAGALHGQLNRQITPQQLDWLFSAELVLATILGGSRDFIGPVLGAFVFVGLDEISEHWPWGRSALMGSLLILVVFLFPRGLAGAARLGIDRIRRLKS
jgi:branched-chain amino acid transport system permease protein